MDQKCKIQVAEGRPKKTQTMLGMKRRCYYNLKWTYSKPSKGIFTGDLVMNNSKAEPLEFSSLAAATRAHDRLCTHGKGIEVPEAFVVNPETGKALIREVLEENLDAV